MDNIKILVVDDDKKILDFIKIILRNHSIVMEASPEKALELMRKEQFNIFIIDYQMPLLTGIQLLKEINKVYAEKSKVAILCTAFGTTYLFDEELKKKLFDFFLEKPFTVNSLKETMTKAIVALGKKQSHSKKN